MAVGASREAQEALREFAQRLDQLRRDAGDPDGPRLIEADATGRLTKSVISELQKGRAGLHRVHPWEAVSAFVAACRVYDERNTRVLSAARTELAHWKGEYTTLVNVVERLDRVAAAKQPEPGPGPELSAIAPPPAVPAGFTGREDDLRGLLDLLGRGTGTAVVVASVRGMGGIGKTTLALATAHAALAGGAFTGAVFLDLRGYDDTPLDAGQVLDGVLRQLGVEPESIPPDHDQRAAVYRAQLALRARQGEGVLVVADNASRAEQIERLLPGEGPHRLLVTSRDDLSAVGACLVDLDVLPAEQAVELLDVTVRTTLPQDTRLAADVDGARRAAALCGYLPLALRIAAAQLVADRALKPGQLAEELADPKERLDLLDDGTRTVRAVLERSVRRLTHPQEQLFGLLSVNPGLDFATETVVAFAGVGKAKDVRARLAALQKASLLRQDPVTGRWSMHDLVRAYADELAQRQPSVAGAALARLLTFYENTTLDAATHLTPRIRGNPERFCGRVEALRWLDTEHANLLGAVQAAHSVGRHTLPLRLSAGLVDYQELRRLHEDQLTMCRIARDSAEAVGDDTHIAGTWINLGIAFNGLRRFEDAETAFRTALQAFQGLGDDHNESVAWENLGVVLGHQGRYEDAEEAHRAALTIHRRLGNPHTEAASWNSLGSTLSALERDAEAETAFFTALAGFQCLGDRAREATVWGNLGIALQQRGESTAAVEATERAVAMFDEVGDHHQHAEALGNLATALEAAGRDISEVRAVREAAAEAYRRAGDEEEARKVLEGEE
ncbi:tetratricopeptide repeat protein [Kitasatospora sp. NPDC057965]|uniref:tetratricopeptide repeat protein n=1 Tax=Kitasatospora sp. NPDC057965 TaxID=3346291 RepID=UPI0036DA8346